MRIALEGLATAVPPHVLPQSEVIDRARTLLAPRFPAFDRIVPAFTNAGIDKRHSVVPIDWFGPAIGWRARNDRYIEGAAALFRDAARAAMEDAGVDARQIDAVVTVSSTGVATPTLEALSHKALGFRDDIMRVPVFGLGCAGGASGLGIARDLAAAAPGRRVLLVAVETCTLGFRMDVPSKADLIATALFGDGAAAAVLGPGEGPALSRGGQQIWPDTLRIMGWDVDELGLGVVFDQSIPAFVTERMADGVDRLLHTLGRARPDRFICHPGGAKVVTAIEDALGLGDGTLQAEREVLRDYGNMSAPTVLFVLDRLRRQGALPRAVLLALGPGFTLSGIGIDP